MEIRALSQPVAGLDFMYTVSGGSGLTTISVYINEQLARRSDCPDPPCHEILLIPSFASGVMVVSAIDSTGAEVRRTFSIRTETSGSAMSYSAMS